MDKAYTYADFITESMNYQHSQEYYGIMKEMAEIELMSSYLASQQFLAEEASEYSFVEGYLVEAGDTEPVKNKIAEKAKNLIKKIVEALKKAWEVFVKFIKSIPDKVKGLYDKLIKGDAVTHLLFVAKTANDDPKGLSRLFKKYGDIIELPSFYSGWNMAASEERYSRHIEFLSSDFNVAIALKEFARISSILANIVNGDKTNYSAVDVFFKFSPDRYSYFKDKAASISYSSIYLAVNLALKASTKIGSSEHAMEDLFKNLTDNFSADTPGATEVWVTIRADADVKKSVLVFKDSFHKAIEIAEDVINESDYIDPKELKYFNEVNHTLTWVFSEYMIANNYAMKLVADIAKLAGKISEEYKTEQDKINDEYKNLGNNADQ